MIVTSAPRGLVKARGMIRIGGECERVAIRADRMSHPMPCGADRAILHGGDRPERGAAHSYGPGASAGRPRAARACSHHDPVTVGPRELRRLAALGGVVGRSAARR